MSVPPTDNVVRRLSEEIRTEKVDCVRRVCAAVAELGYTIGTKRRSATVDLDPAGLQQLADCVAMICHETWIQSMTSRAWRYGPMDAVKRRHPNLVPFSCLSDVIRGEYRSQATFIVDAFGELGSPIHIENGAHAQYRMASSSYLCSPRACSLAPLGPMRNR